MELQRDELPQKPAPIAMLIALLRNIEMSVSESPAVATCSIETPSTPAIASAAAPLFASRCVISRRLDRDRDTES